MPGDVVGVTGELEKKSSSRCRKFAGRSTITSGGAGASLASSAAYGNSVSGSLCGSCDTNAPGLMADNHQVNSGDVRAHSAVTGSRSDLVATTSTAIGNAATYQSNGPS